MTEFSQDNKKKDKYSIPYQGKATQENPSIW